MSAAPVMVQNRTDTIVVLASDPKQTHEVIWGALGAQDGTDIQPVPEEIIRTPAFARSLAIGIIAVVDGGEGNDAVQAALKIQGDAYRKRLAQEKDASLAVLETEPDNDLVAVQCIGPGTRPDTRCEDTIPVRAREMNASPPLCTRHAILADRCVRRGNGPWTLEE